MLATLQHGLHHTTALLRIQKIDGCPDEVSGQSHLNFESIYRIVR
jgi:hypothetical protein